ncbi:hypothetical protein EB796_021715 [Bugula neritina]|uniref:Uncharacterized protein n=1 Tax=Bugula neritina TaxID=10212 RepID=A0A7J7J1J2_BUGNE|nr:hypothetical protein EB796_021715 [Bugula neritina]
MFNMGMTRNGGTCNAKSGMGFPNKQKDFSRWNVWWKVSRCQEEPGERSLLCSDHFYGDSFERTSQPRRLRSGAVPAEELVAVPERLIIEHETTQEYSRNHQQVYIEIGLNPAEDTAEYLVVKVEVPTDVEIELEPAEQHGEHLSAVNDISVNKDEKPFQCSRCDYKCNQRSRLATHILTHTGEKPFQCSRCDYRCALKSNLAKHMLTHTGEKPFQCSRCDYKCNQQSSLARHIVQSVTIDILSNGF